jgi:short-chain Z-isoprenyl diphosphate synthase
MWARDALVAAYSARLRRSLDPQQAPKHVGVILDGNRRWASLQGSSSAEGHRAGAAKIKEFLGWCEGTGVEVVTLWLLSTDNVNRPQAELEELLAIISETVRDLADQGRWRLHPVGALDLLPAKTAEVLKQAEADTAAVQGMLVNVAVGYGGRREVVDAVKALLAEQQALGASLDDLAAMIDVEHIGRHLYTSGQPDPDLLIRTSGEQRLSGFLLWQSAHSEFYFCEAYWPDFREVDFLRAIRSFETRQRRYGT